METLVCIYVHPDDADLSLAIQKAFPHVELGTVRPVGAELAVILAVIQLTAAALQVFETILSSFKDRPKSYLIFDGKQILLSNVKMSDLKPTSVQNQTNESAHSGGDPSNSTESEGAICRIQPIGEKASVKDDASVEVKRS